MERLKPMLRWDEVTGNRIKIGDVTVTPQSRALVVAWRGGGIVWNRPWALRVEQDGGVRRIPIVDLTRVMQVLLFGVSLMVFLAGCSVSVRQRRKGNER